MDAGRDAAAERVVAVHAHPDDETITMGGTLARLVAQGAAVTVVTATRGECGEVIPDDLAPLKGSDELAAHRTAELVVALTALGVGDHRFLGDTGARAPGLAPRVYRDSGMQWGPGRVPVPLEPVQPDSLIAATEEEEIADLVAVLRQVDAGVVLSYDAGGGYGHPDHVRTARIAERAAELLGLRLLAVLPEAAPPEPGDVVIELSPEDYARKRAAFQAHATQLVVEGDEARLSSGPAFAIGRVERFRPSTHASATEIATVERPTLGSRLLSGVVGVLVGAVAGAITTVAHQSTVSIGSVVLPLGLLASLAGVLLLLLGLRLVLVDRFVAFCTAMGLLTMVGLLALRSAGGSVLVPANGLGVAWTFLPALIALVVIAWPRLRTPAPVEPLTGIDAPSAPVR
ncbi:PIG-L family deacetylase [Rathayibacter tanaceti]|uniref:1D-myo-inositol 2-acetamido-2-deoxy-alpha-D-glucopyranoside deacetylase n=2 Tax=Rathayibacter tanaceti TaxID=1671680 RepID=A0A166IF09_9MICO|nr:PIG-L family deacetylase [Rathayibacter tanaceti]KZX22274.1 1D-myo-inositol 2-acetamido-2-deoxy-alpha-D-glucopyranoside deacetylase [Rathayibacter tanaceti]QHC55881.1 mycothiol biosynthesis protein [Rathayibacter tanaceti]TCO39289.1 N-acetyl-1-D-myo-inositol-2-amino-2-deoxy-alpha-D-glucopyranoside deacetylase [Rathayibacter tanaceti]